jgi:hypothetical protein
LKGTRKINRIICFGNVIISGYHPIIGISCNNYDTAGENGNFFIELPAGGGKTILLFSRFMLGAFWEAEERSAIIPL